MLCGVVDMKWSPQHVVLLVNSTDTHLCHVLCEVDSPDHESHARSEELDGSKITLSETYESFSASKFVTCPNKHLTHAFLACDSTSSCWVETELTFDDLKESWDIPSSSSCRVNMTSLPPSFLCTSGVQRVPYTLVCDHRADCQDNSDEDFCRFLLSEGTPSLRCSNSKEVRDFVSPNFFNIKRRGRGIWCPQH